MKDEKKIDSAETDLWIGDRFSPPELIVSFRLPTKQN
jgi:hypothetical protein